MTPPFSEVEAAQESLLRTAITNMDQACFNACQLLFDFMAQQAAELARLRSVTDGEVEAAYEAQFPVAANFKDSNPEIARHHAGFRAGAAWMAGRGEG